ncbi:hypothetical protein HDE77_002957 [Rhodanobacter sp. MP7CTX1]|nr:hypothetical protein [Rhodanobacter sp. MP7CTX1]
MTSGNLKLGFAICDLLSGGLGRKCGYLLTSTDDKAKLSPLIFAHHEEETRYKHQVIDFN